MKYVVEFVDQRDPEEVSADRIVDHPPFVDFVSGANQNARTVARYRADDIRKVSRED